MRRAETATKPLVAIVAHNDGTETTDFLVPFGILSRANDVEVVTVSLRSGPVTLMPALTIRAQSTIDEFDRAHGRGADYVIVPAMHVEDDPGIVQWILSQRAKGATILGVCSGARVLGHAGLLDGRKATGHWDDVDRLRSKYRSMQWVPNRRYVADRGVVTTTGVTASAPVSIALIEAVAGRDEATKIAGEIGLPRWDASHDSSRFDLTGGVVWTAATNQLAWFNHEIVAVPSSDGIDEVALALIADAHSRTYRSRAIAVASAGDHVMTRHGLRLETTLASSADADVTLLPFGERPPVTALDVALDDIERRYGRRTRDFVALQLEYAPRE
ncbi:Transcriptional regulator, AraC family [Labilithrix luteola]|uniref:Transcriptional regulator, AraC family n=2 Tax=Labilithrix luteola TaxID=1391654 RepID=A0A0K1PU33_9BACT|nr:Transcriptional regulator, AraC family [Labilithrix luteola]